MTIATGTRALITADEVFNLPLFEMFLVVDCSVPRRVFDAGHVFSALHFPGEVAEVGGWVVDRLGEYGYDHLKPVVVYGHERDDVRTAAVAATLRDALPQDFRGRECEVRVLAGGYEAFRAEFPFMCEGRDDGGELVMTGPTPTKITDRVFLGSEAHASSPEVFSALNLTHCLNVSNEVDNFFERRDLGATRDVREAAPPPPPPHPAVKYMRIPLPDDEKSNLCKFFFNAQGFIDGCVEDGAGNILVHCHHGKSRSVAVVIAYLMSKREMSRDAAYEFVKQKRTHARPNNGFMRQLQGAW